MMERLLLWAYGRRARRQYEHMIGWDVPPWYRARQIRRRRPPAPEAAHNQARTYRKG